MNDVFNSLKTFLIKAAKSLLTCRWYIRIKKIAKSSPYKNAGFRKIKSPKDRFYADPFIFKKNNVNYIFFEDYLYEKEKGVISCISIDKSGVFTLYPAVLEREYHLSYPFVFEFNSKIYMISETSENKTIEIYKAISFPKKWVLEKVLLKNINAVDATMIKNNDLYWLFAGVAEDGKDFNKNLHLYYANSPFGPWTPHLKNPIVSDRRRARPAGKLFYEGNALMRPGQDCSLCYGRAVWIHRIEILNQYDYREVPVRKIKPFVLSRDIGTHTLNFNEDYAVIDRKAITRNPIYFKSK